VAAVVATAPVARASAAAFTPGSASVKPREAFFDARGGITIRFRFDAPRPTDVSVRIAGGGREVRRQELKQLEPGAVREFRWDGLTEGRKPAPDGRYRVLVGTSGSDLALAGRVTLRGHRHPVPRRHGSRGPVGEFGAARTGGRWHQGFDVLAPCGTPLVAARGGTVVRRRYDPRLDGHFVVISGRKEGLTYRYSHLIAPAKVTQGERVFTGQRIGFVGDTGNARTTPCHLHFELRKRSGRFLDPEPRLRAWDRHS
jgi:murein DD-endopeptidase MepM/ murein hydrolase activator NlpD